MVRYQISTSVVASVFLFLLEHPSGLFVNDQTSGTFVRLLGEQDHEALSLLHLVEGCARERKISIKATSISTDQLTGALGLIITLGGS